MQLNRNWWAPQDTPRLPRAPQDTPGLPITQRSRYRLAVSLPLTRGRPGRWGSPASFVDRGRLLGYQQEEDPLA